MSDAVHRRLGAAILEPGLVEFRVWAPNAGSVAVLLGDDEHELSDAGDGVFEGELFADAGDDYWLVLPQGRFPDPCSRFQPEGVRGPSRIVDTGSFAWHADRPAFTLDELVIYELHVGCFSEAGTFDGAIEHLPALRELGVTAIELMPVATFPGNRGWGYDGLYSFAPHPAYGGPEGLVRLVDAAHQAGLGIILDVVYNHIGPGSETIAAFGPYFTDRHDTFWGAAIDYAQDGVREWALQNAEQWIRDYRIDGLRLDAVHAIYDERDPHVLAELTGRVKAINPAALVISEVEIGDWRPIEEWGHDAQWVDSAHHGLHVQLTGEHDGYYDRFGEVDKLANDLLGAGHDPRKQVICAQNHDQIGNRAFGDRLSPAALRVAAACTLFSPCTPLLFMGEEYGETNPFQFFTDHIDPAIAEATRSGRKREFASFAAFAGAELPDPQAEETFLRSKLDRSQASEETRAFYAELLRLRRELPPETEAVPGDRALTLRRGPVELHADFAAQTVELRP
ncbi:MAG: maltooligosyltrehalose trehalohydrolase [Gaiellaceae bacterium]|nr:maltooligosyltrehalose trehalohydrolase [Gaiellaceae bacterium]